MQTRLSAIPALGRASSAHIAAFSAAVQFAAVAPGRVNLIGEHTDYNDGLVLPLAIQHVCAAAVSPRGDTRVRIIAADLPATANFFACDLREIDPASFRESADNGGSRHWPAFVVGPAALIFQSAPRGIGADITVASDVPLGAGLSSSAAVEVAVATALCALWQVRLAPLELAKLCQRAEHEFAGVPCGLMDQLASVFGREGRALLIDCRENSIDPIPLPGPSQAVLVVANSGVRHALAGGEYAARRAACHAAARAMGLASLRDASPASLAAATLTEVQRSCATHVMGENQRVREFAEALREGGVGGSSLAAAGAMMYASHASLRDVYRVSCPELDTLVEIAGAVPGVFGSRMTGGGFGGCTITLCTPAAVAPLKNELRARYRAAHGRECEVFEVTASAGARLIERDSI